EDDLKRRDLTINSIAIDQKNKVIDPFNGQADLQNRILRHTSIDFIEDPLRVVRLARFKAQLSNFKFSIAQEMLALI
ncbi:tRNA CCA-pyrophosphorylase, partial [Francisella tularensis subsp. holarctica]|nr:tRNA CCA-pyrophosphorylase [Francisella tularensis subsp. holarctica]